MKPQDTEANSALRFRRPAAPFTVLPNPVLRSPRLSPLAKTLYALLRSYAWQQDHAFPGQARLAREVPCSINTVTRGLRELVRHRREHLVGGLQRRGDGVHQRAEEDDRDRDQQHVGDDPADILRRHS